MSVVAVHFTVDQEVGVTAGEVELGASNAGERLECGTRCPAAVRAVAVSGIFELISHLVFHRAAQASAR
jgi:hypothetical protein